MRKALSTLCAFSSLGLVCAVANATTITMVCELRGGQETPPNLSAGSGCGRFTVDTVANTVSYRIVWGGFAETAAHIHGFAGPGVAAGVLHPLPAGNPKVGVWNYAEAQEADILAGLTYVNIHSAAFPAGEIRGQINHFAAALDGGQENPANTISSEGWGTFRINTCANTLDYHIVVESLSSPETAAHIHGTALPGTNAGVLHPLPLGPVKTGTWTYPESLEPSILNGLMYVNVHSNAFPGGEIRGQIVNTIAPVDGAQEVPPNPSPGVGNAYIAYDRPANTLGFYVTFGGLTSAETASHFHGFAPPGVNAGVLFNIGVSNPKKGAWPYGAANAANVLGGLIYLNIHTTMFPGGEIRGQIVPAAPRCQSDINCDGATNIDDLLATISGWGPCRAPPTPCPADTNYSGTIDIDDLLTVISGWGPCP
jgi:hypothetical protein